MAASTSQFPTGPGSGGLRQSMAWLHTWTGLLVGWVLYFMFVTGTFGYINAEVDRWMQPEGPLPSVIGAEGPMVVFAEQRLRVIGEGADQWSIQLPGSRGSEHLSIYTWKQAQKEGEDGEQKQELLDTRTGAVLPPVKTRETAGGGTLYSMHYALHYFPDGWAQCIVGFCTMFMLVAIVSGVITHKKIFKDFFTFRPGKGQRSWLDGHNLLSVTALPFHVMITWSGLVFYMSTYMPVAREVLYPEGWNRYEAELHGSEESQTEEPPKNAIVAAPLVPLGPLLAEVQENWGTDLRLSSVEIHHPGRSDARVTFWTEAPGVAGDRWEGQEFEGATGQRVNAQGSQEPGVETFRRTLLNLHEGRFAGPLLRLLYVVTSFVATAMIGTGLLLWSNKRKARLRETERPHFGIRTVDVLNLGTIVGLPIGVAAYFWANRLIPVGLENRVEWEVHTLFVTWGLCFVYALARPNARAWVELCALAALAWGLLPALNAITTERHLAVTIPAGDWALASLDLGMFAVGILFAFFARTISRKQRRVSDSPNRLKRGVAVPAQSRGVPEVS